MTTPRTVIRKIINCTSTPFRLYRAGDEKHAILIDGFDTLPDVKFWGEPAAPIDVPAVDRPGDFQKAHLELADASTKHVTKLWVGGPGMLVRVSERPFYNNLAPPVVGIFRSGGERTLTIDVAAVDGGPPRLILTDGRVDAPAGHSFETPGNSWMAYLADRLAPDAKISSLRIPGALFAGSECLDSSMRAQQADVSSLFQAGVRFFQLALALNGQSRLVCCGSDYSPHDAAQSIENVARPIAKLCDENPGEIVVVALTAAPSFDPAVPNLGGKIIDAFGDRVMPPSVQASLKCVDVWNANKSIILVDLTKRQSFKHPQIHDLSWLSMMSSGANYAPPSTPSVWCLAMASKPGVAGSTHAERWIRVEGFSKQSVRTNVVAFRDVRVNGPEANHLLVLASLLNAGYEIRALDRPRNGDTTKFFINDVCPTTALREIRGVFDGKVEPPLLSSIQCVFEYADGSESAQTAGNAPGVDSSLFRVDEGDSILNTTTQYGGLGGVTMLQFNAANRQSSYGMAGNGPKQVSEHARVAGFCGLVGSSRIEALWPIVRTKA